MIIPAGFNSAPEAFGLNNELGYTFCRQGVPSDVTSEYPLLTNWGLKPLVGGITCAARGWSVQKADNVYLQK